MSENRIEILAPAGSKNQLEAAISAGANAVYLGMQNFSARKGAKNFTVEELESAIIFSHQNNVKVYVAINTLIKDSEIEEAVNLIDKIYMLGADALIIQDFGLLYIIKNRYRGMQIHASTQMSIHNKDAGIFVKRNGVDRVILARELSLGEIKDIADSGIDTEVFIHGAICISYSGQCQFSINKGNRSANRGSCAQPCRQSYKLYENGNFIKQGHLISPKERSLLDEINVLKETGVKSFKIEGRLRNEYYVFEVVRQYLKALEGDPFNIKPIAQIFNRDGFTSSYIYGKSDSDMITGGSGSNSGLFLGKIKNGEVDLKENLQAGDGISVRNGKGFIVTKISRQKNGNYIIFPRKYKDGDLIFKTSDALQKKQIRESIKSKLSEKHSIKVPVNVIFVPEKPIRVSGANFDFTLEGDKVELAKKAPLSAEKVIEQLSKKSFEGVELQPNLVEFNEGFLPISSINKIRRDWIEKYKMINLVYGGVERFCPLPYSINDFKDNHSNIPRNDSWKTLVIVSKKEQMKAYIDLELKDSKLCVNPYFKDKGYIGKKEIDFLEKNSINYFIQTREIIRTEMNDIILELSNLKFLEGIVSANLGLIERVMGKVKIIGDVGLNIYNSFAKNLFPGIDYFIPSTELENHDLFKLRDKDSMLPVSYSKVKLMHMEYCPNKNGDPCSEPCRKNDFSLDNYKLLHDNFCRVSILNDEYKKIDSPILKENGFDKKTIILTDESFDETLNILKTI